MPWPALEKVTTPRRATLAGLLVVFVLTRVFLLTGAIGFPGKSDVETTYREWAVEIVADGQAPYSDVDIEYPPASLPFVLLPQLLGDQEREYRIGFVVLMLIADLMGAWMLVSLGRRRGSLLGIWIWTLALLLLGPLVYLRLDLVPAAATVWMIERADRGRWLGAGAALGLAIAVKAYAIVLLPLAVLLCPEEWRKRFLLAGAALIFLPLLPFIAVIAKLLDSVVGYHSARGIQIESLWGSLLYILRSRDRIILILHNYGAHHFEFGMVPTIKMIASAVTVVAVVVGTWVASRVRQRLDGFASAAFVTITLVVAVASVFSPQFMIWVIALAAAAASFPASRVSRQALLITVVAGVTGLIYPTLHPGLVRAEALSIVVVWGRNLLLLLTGIYGAVRLTESVSGPSTAELASPGTR